MDSAVKIHTVTIISVSVCSVNELGHEGHIYICTEYVINFSGICNSFSLRHSKENLWNIFEIFGKIKFMRTFNFGHV